MKIRYFIPAVIAMSLASCGGSGNASDNGSDTIVDVQVVEVAPVDTFSYKGYTMLADLLAGRMPADSSFMSQITSSPAFATHMSEQAATWQQFKTNVVDKVHTWAAENLKENCDTIFYPFGGPDFNYLSTFFPDARYSVLIGIEKPGELPLTGNGGISQLNALRKSVGTNMRSSFFVTKDMAKDLNNDIEGTLPVMLMFMGMHGYEVITVNPVELDNEGNIAYTDPDRVWAHSLDKKFDNGYEILYRKPGEKGSRAVCYLRTDLRNPGVETSGLEKMVADKFKGQAAMVKAASYCMHAPDFSRVRDAVLNNCDLVLTGPSGIPYKAFDLNTWDIALHGEYCPPIGAFSGCPQNDLRDAYAHTATKPLGFRYDYGRGSQLFVARRK